PPASPTPGLAAGSRATCRLAPQPRPRRRGPTRRPTARAAGAPPQRAHAPPDSPRRSRGPAAEGPRAARQPAPQPRPRRRGPTRRPTARAAAAAPPQRAHAPPASPRRRRGPAAAGPRPARPPPPPPPRRPPRARRRGPTRRPTARAAGAPPAVSSLTPAPSPHRAHAFFQLLHGLRRHRQRPQIGVVGRARPVVVGAAGHHQTVLAGQPQVPLGLL